MGITAVPDANVSVRAQEYCCASEFMFSVCKAGKINKKHI